MSAKKEIKYYVIGGQYAHFCHGGTPTLLGAKRLANKSLDYWDNWQGWHRPQIYRAEDCAEGVNFYGRMMMPKDDTVPLDW